MTQSPPVWYQQQLAALTYRRGLSYASQQSYQKAIAAFSEAIENGYRHSAQAYVMRGISHLQREENAAAIADFETVIHSEPAGEPTAEQAASRTSQADAQALAKAHYYRGLLRQQAGDEAWALADWSVAIAHWPSYAEPHYHRALVSLSQGHHSQALVDLDAALAADPTMVSAYLQRGNLRYQLKDIPGAVADWEIAVSNDFTLEEAKQKLASVQRDDYDAQLTAVLEKPLADKGLTVEVNHGRPQIDIHVHRQLGTGINYYTLPDLIRTHLVPLHLAEITRFRLFGYLADVNRPEWQQSYDLYKGQPCPPSNWQTAFSTLVLFPPFGVPAFIQACRVKQFYDRGKYLDALSASKAVKGLCVAGSVTLGFFTLLPLGYVAYDSMQETSNLHVAGELKEAPHRPYHELFRDKGDLH
ncbi:MAG: tetratricopeptide repeat protein [Phormidesmis sp.]